MRYQIPKFAPPPLSAQNKSGFSAALACTMEELDRTTSNNAVSTAFFEDGGSGRYLEIVYIGGRDAVKTRKHRHTS